MWALQKIFSAAGTAGLLTVCLLNRDRSDGFSLTNGTADRWVLFDPRDGVDGLVDLIDRIGAARVDEHAAIGGGQIVCRDRAFAGAIDARSVDRDDAAFAHALCAAFPSFFSR